MSRRPWYGECPACHRTMALRWVGGDPGSWVLRKHGACDGWGYDPVEGTVQRDRPA